jgi:glycerate 2-kinase
VSEGARRLILDAFAEALAAASPSAAVQRAIRRAPAGGFDISGAEFAKDAAFEIVAIGKAAPAMARGACDGLGNDRVRRGFILTNDGQEDAGLGKQFEVHVGSHPVLDARSVRATAKLIEWLAGVEANVICLISGGGSALLEAPIDGISLADMQATTRILLHAGADIRQLNAVRSHLSRVKGGGLRAVIPATRVATLALSDVLGNDLGVIASGPTVPPSTNQDDAERVVTELGVIGALPESVRRSLTGTGRTSPATFQQDVAVIVADNRTAVDTARRFLENCGFRVRELQAARTGEARDSARGWVASLRDAGENALIAGGELTVTVRGDGAGGRNTEFALAAAIELEQLGLNDWSVASLATDGQDAVTGAAGAIVDAETPARLRTAGVDPEAALANNDTFPGLDLIGATVYTGPTGTNVNDLYFAVRVAKSD